MTEPDFHIIPFDPLAWKEPDDKREKPTSDLDIDLDDFECHLKEAWPQAKIYNWAKKEHPSLVWNIKPEGSKEIFAGKVYSKQLIYFAEYPADISFEFALWYRAYIHSRHRLFMFRDGSWNALELTSETMYHDVVEYFSTHDLSELP